MGKALLLGVASALAACNPFGGASAFTCSTDEDCSTQGTIGFCEADKLCSFADSSCASGRKYGELAGNKSNTCVGGDGVDGGVDMPPDMPPDPQDTCFGDPAGLAKPCFAPADVPAGDLQLSGTLDTTNDTRCSTVAKQIDLAKVCVIAANSIQVSAAGLRATGTRSLVMVAVTTIQIGGVLDAASHRGDSQLGPAADAATCNAGTAPSGNKDGGAGGSYADLGGGGAGGGGKGVPGAAVAPSIAQGGCPGQDGGGGAGGTKGNGGGVVYLIANGSITVGATVNASGAGAGPGGAGQAGGAGGGSGGLIGLDSPTVTNGSAIFANGGGGGEGGTQNNNLGDPGDDPVNGGVGAGGNLSGTGGDGGDGGAAANIAGSPGQNGSTGGNGGGGGSAGVIKLFRATAIVGGQVSPNPS